MGLHIPASWLRAPLALVAPIWLKMLSGIALIPKSFGCAQFALSSLISLFQIFGIGLRTYILKLRISSMFFGGCGGGAGNNVVLGNEVWTMEHVQRQISSTIPNLG